MTEWLFILATGSFAYTFFMTRNIAKQDQIDRLQARIDEIYKLLLGMNGNDEKKNARKDPE